MAGFMAGLAEGYHGARKRMAAEEARKEELAYRRAKDKAEEERFKLTHAESKRKTEFENRKYLLEKRIEERKLREAKQKEVDLRTWGLMQQGILSPTSTIEVKDTDVSTGWGDELETINKESIDPRHAASLIRLGIPLNLAKKAYRIGEGKITGEKLKPLLTSIYDGSIQVNSKLLKERPELFDHFKKQGIFSNENELIDFSNKKHIIYSKKNILDKDKNNFGNFYRLVWDTSVINGADELVNLVIPPIKKDKKEISYSDQAVVDIKNNPELPARLYMAINGALSNARQNGEDSFERVKRTLRKSKKLMNHLTIIRQHFNENPYIEIIGQDREPLGEKSLRFAEEVNKFLDEKPSPSSASDQVAEQKIQPESKVVSNSPSEHANKSTMPHVLKNVTSTALKVIEPKYGASLVSKFNKVEDKPEYWHLNAIAKYTDWGNDPLTPEQKQILINSGVPKNIISKFSDEDAMMDKIANNFLEYALSQGLTDDTIKKIAPSVVSLNWLYYDKNDRITFRNKMEPFSGSKTRGPELLREIDGVKKAKNNVDDLLFLLASNEELVENIKKEKGNEVFVNQITQKVTWGAVLAEKVKSEFNTLGEYLFGDNEQNYSALDSKLEDIVIRDASGNSLGSVQSRLKEKMNNELKNNENTFINSQQKDLYARIQLQKVRLAYQLAGAFQGGGSGSRTISDQDFSIIMEAVWANNDADVASKLNELNHSLSRQLVKKELQYNLEGKGTRLYESISDKMNKFGNIFYKKYRQKVKLNNITIPEKNSQSPAIFSDKRLIRFNENGITGEPIAVNLLSLDSKIENFNKNYRQAIYSREPGYEEMAKKISSEEIDSIESDIKGYLQFRLEVYNRFMSYGDTLDNLYYRHKDKTADAIRVGKVYAEPFPKNLARHRNWFFRLNKYGWKLGREATSIFYGIISETPSILQGLSANKNVTVSFNKKEQEERMTKLIKIVKLIDSVRELRGEGVNSLSNQTIDVPNSEFEAITIHDFPSKIGGRL